ncbi:MAG: hypothetical protein ACPGU7_05520 [Gammaproteobacteria bacterium]
MKPGILITTLALVFAPLLTHAAEPAAGTALDGVELKELLVGKTADCVKEKDQSTCVNYFAPDGNFFQVRDSGKRKTGRWFVDDSNRTCLLWDGKIKPLCFTVQETESGHYQFIKGGKLKSTITALTEGNRDNLE